MEFIPFLCAEWHQATKLSTKSISNSELFDVLGCKQRIYVLFMTWHTFLVFCFVPVFYAKRDFLNKAIPRDCLSTFSAHAFLLCHEPGCFTSWLITTWGWGWWHSTAPKVIFYQIPTPCLSLSRPHCHGDPITPKGSSDLRGIRVELHGVQIQNLMVTRFENSSER